MDVSGLYIRFDRFSEKIPFLSTAMSLVDLFLKYVYIPRSGLSSNTFHQYVQCKPFWRIAALMIPILGNIYVAYLERGSSLQAESAIEGFQPQEREALSSLKSRDPNVPGNDLCSSGISNLRSSLSTILEETAQLESDRSSICSEEEKNRYIDDAKIR